MRVCHVAFAMALVVPLASVLSGCGARVEVTDSGTGGAPGDGGDPGHLFVCGGSMCNSAHQYCLHHGYQGGCAGMEYDSCEDLPSSCGDTPDCACLPDNECWAIELGQDCTESNGELRTCVYEVC